jgi:putative ABC transport system permease protein
VLKDSQVNLKAPDLDMPKKPPRIATSILRWILPPKDRDYLLGDYEESFQRKFEEKNALSASLWYWIQAVQAAPEFLLESFYWRIVMFRNYLIVGLRNIKRHKGFSSINILGLAVGMATFILMMFYVRHELSFDKFHAKYNRLYRVIRTYPENPNIPFKFIPSTPAPLSPTMVDEFPEVVSGTRIGDVTGSLNYKNKAFSETGIFADEFFLDLFSFEIIKGNRETCLSLPYEMVITEKLAQKYFGSEEPIGKVLSFSKQMDVHTTGSQNESYDLTITGVISDVPKNSHLQFDYIISFTSSPQNQERLSDWGRSSYYNYVELLPSISYISLHDRLAEYTPRFRGKDIAKYILQPLKNLHWQPVSYEFPGVATNDKKTIILFSTIAFFILLIACINYVNLATARYAKRTKEIGLRKVIGAQRPQLITQFIGESVLVSFVSSVFSILLVYLVLPSFKFLVDRDIQLIWLSNPWIPLIVFGMVLFSGLFSGSYPALLLSSLRPAAVLKGKMERKSRGVGLRNVLVAFQFVVSVCLIVGTLVVWHQMRFIRTADIGYDREHVIVMPLRDEFARKNGKVLEKELLRDNRILAASGSEFIPLERNNIWNIHCTNETGEKVSADAYTCEIGYGLFDVFRVEIVQGRNFSPAFMTDEFESVLLNQAAVNAIGLKDPIGKVIDSQGRRVIGVIKDYHHSSLHEKIDPMIYFLRPEAYSFLSVRIKPGDIPGTISFLRRIVSRYSLNFAFEYYFQDEYFNEKYKLDRRFGATFGFASGLAIFIACLGVFGLISFSTERRTKEIAIRKVLGASVPSILRRLSKEFISLVVFSNCIAWPIAFFTMNKWLQKFAFRIRISLWTFLLALILSLAISILVVIFKALHTATSNPVNSLRYE